MILTLRVHVARVRSPVALRQEKQVGSWGRKSAELEAALTAPVLLTETSAGKFHVTGHTTIWELK